MIWTLPISSKGQITIPLKVRKELGLTGSNRRVLLQKKEHTLIMEPITGDIMDLYGIIKTDKHVEDMDEVIRIAKTIRTKKRALRGLE